MRLSNNIRPSGPCIALIIAGLILAVADRASAEITYTSRFSQIELQSSNMGGLSALSETTTVDAIFNQGTDGQHTQMVAGGFINTGSWDVGQFSFADENMIVAQGNTETQIGGDGIGTLIGLNTFEIEFESVGDTDYVFSGSHFGTAAPGAKDAIEVFLEEFDGVTFQPIYTSIVGDDSILESGTFDDGGLYRLRVFSRAFSQGNEAHQSGYDLQLSFSSIPEPSGATLLGLAGMGILGFVRRRRL